MFNKVNRMLRSEDAAGVLAGCIDGCTVSALCCCPFCGLCGSIGGCTGDIINAIFSLCW